MGSVVRMLLIYPILTVETLIEYSQNPRYLAESSIFWNRQVCQNAISNTCAIISAEIYFPYRKNQSLPHSFAELNFIDHF